MPDEEEAQLGPHLTEDTSQRVYDERMLLETIHQIRQLLASAKVNQRLAQMGLLEKEKDLHPEKFRQAIEKHETALATMVKLYAEMDDDGIKPSRISVGHPANLKPGDVVKIDPKTGALTQT